MDNTVTDLEYPLPLDRVVRIHRTVDGEFTCCVSRHSCAIMHPGFATIDRAVRWAQAQLNEIPAAQAEGEGE